MKTPSRSKWVKKWEVNGSNDEIWVVSQDREGNFGCSCPVWKFKRHECKHIQEIKGQLAYQRDRGGPMGLNRDKPKYILAMIGKPTFKPATNELLIPLVKIGDLHMEATICHNMLKYGYTMDEIRQIRNIKPDHLNAQKIREYIETYGEAEYPVRKAESDEPEGQVPSPTGR